MANEKVMKEASEHARLADEANERAAEKEASAAKLREQADKLSVEAAEERALANREVAAAQAALRDGGIGANPPPAGGVQRHERIAMNDKQKSSSKKEGFPMGILAAIAATIALLLVLFWLWTFGAKTDGADNFETFISGLKSDMGTLSTKVDGLGSAIKGVDGKLDTLKGEVGALKDCACDKKDPPKTPVRLRAAKPVKPAVGLPVTPPHPAESKFWGWIHPEATATNKRICYTDRRITGMPAQCSSVEIFPREGNETEVQWNGRVAAKNGIYIGAKDEKGVISGITFGRVHVK